MASTISAGTTSGTAIAIAGDTSGALALQTNGTTTAVTIDTSQNVGIGITSPAYKLDVVSTANSIGNNIAARNTTSGTAAGSQMIVGNDATPDLIAIRALSTTYTSSGFNTADGALIRASGAGGLSLAANNGSGIVNFFTGGTTERMRIDSSGNLLVGATATISGAKMVLEGSVSDNLARFRNTSSAPYGMQITYTTVAPNNTTQGFLECYDTGGQRATIRSNGGLANYSANNVNLSDQREKKDIELAGNYLDKVCAIPVKTFLFNDQTDTDLNLGVIAQDVQAVAPELVSETNWADKDQPEKLRLSIYQTDLQYALMKAIQELNAKVDAQAATITELQAKVGA